MLIDIGLHARTDVVLITKLCDLIKGHIRVKRSRGVVEIVDLKHIRLIFV